MKKMIGMIIVACVCLFPTLSLATDVGGVIDTDTVWDLAGSPYNIKNTVQIAEGAILTIEPGVVVNGEEREIEVWGTLNAIGTDISRITFNNVSILHSYVSGQDSNAVINIQFSEINLGALFGSGSGGSLTLLDSKIENYSGIAIHLTGSYDCYIERNIFLNPSVNVIHVGGLPDDVEVHIRNNVFYNQSGDANISFEVQEISDTSRILVEYNSFLSTDRVSLRLYPGISGGNITAPNNYWNTTDTNIIDSMIFDKNDDLNSTGYIYYLPFLTEPHPDTPTLDFNQSPIADCGDDKVVFDEVILDSSASYDPDGTIESYDWQLQHRENSDYNTSAQGESPTVSGLEPGFYDVTLTVTDNDGLTDSDTMLLAAAGLCDGWPQPNADFNLKKFKITNFKARNYTSTTMFGTIELPPELNLGDGDTVGSRITIELFNALPDRHLVVSDEATLTVRDGKHLFIIKK